MRTIIMDRLALPTQTPRYAAQIRSGDIDEERTIDAHIPFDSLLASARDRLRERSLQEVLTITRTPQLNIVGMGFEVRHCYQSADSKRIQADEAMARYLLLSGVLPVMLVFCAQSNQTVLCRYKSTWLVKESWQAYTFLKDITSFDFHGFLAQHRDEYRAVVHEALDRIRL